MSQPSSNFPGLVFNVRLFPELTIKSAPVRKRWTKMLCQNIRRLARELVPKTKVVQDWDRIEVRVPSDRVEDRDAIIDLLARIPGIAFFSEVKVLPFVDLDHLQLLVISVWAQGLADKTFCVRVKRVGNHDFSSEEAERYIGGGLDRQVPSATVRLKNPQVTVNIEIKNDLIFLVANKYTGLGGYPVGTQEKVLSLISGGFDSTVASFQMMRRGARTHFCFFNLGAKQHELATKEVAYYLWQRFGASHRVKFIAVPFEAVVNEILTKVSPANMGVVLKRMMLRAAEKIAQRGGIEALVTGEAVAQVSSQTIPNLAVIDRVCEMLVLRPLIVTGKPEIIDIARAIGVEKLVSAIPEYCSVISVKPSAKVNLEVVEQEEAGFDWQILHDALDKTVRQSIDEVMLDPGSAVVAMEKTNAPPADALIIDVRHPEERELRPLTGVHHGVLSIPFYKLSKEFPNLDTSCHYYLFCERGVMSELHALRLRDEGYCNVDIYRP